MKKSGLLIAGAMVFLFGNSCSKEATNKQEITNSNNFKTADNTISSLSFPDGYLGVYTVQDEKTIFIGQANSQGTNVLLNLSYIQVPTTITPSEDKKHLTMPYGAAAYSDSGWAYIIGYNAATKSLTLEPNDAMIHDIVPNSFEVLAASYDPKRKEGSFVTRFTAIKDNGNETQLSESFFK